MSDRGASEKVCRLSVIELVSTVRRDAFERCGEFGLTENFTRLEKFLIVEQNAAGFRVAAERDRPREHLRSQVAHRMSFGRQFDRRRDQTRPRQASGDAVRLGQAFDRARGGSG